MILILSLSPSVYLSASLFIDQPEDRECSSYLSLQSFFCPSIYLSLYTIYVCLSKNLPENRRRNSIISFQSIVCPSVCLSACNTIYISVCLSINVPEDRERSSEVSFQGFQFQAHRKVYNMFSL